MGQVKIGLVKMGLVKIGSGENGSGENGLSENGLEENGCGEKWESEIFGPYFNVVVDARGPETKFTLETNVKYYFIGL